MNSKNMYNALFQDAADAIYIIALDGSIIEANQEAVRRQQYSYKELLSMKASDLDTEFYAEFMSARIASILSEGQCSFETEHRVKGGAFVAVEVNARLTTLNGNKVIIAVARDISERKKIEATLQRQNNYLNALNETTLGLINRLEIHDLLVAIISRAATLMQTEHGYIYLLNNFKDAMFIQVQLGIFNTFEHHPLKPGEGIAGYVWQSEKPCRIEDYNTWQHRIPDPQRNVLHAMAGVPLTSGDKVIGVIGLAYIDMENIFDDEKMWYLSRAAELASLALDNARLYESNHRELKERKKIEDHLRKLSYVVEQSPVSILITDKNGDIEYANPHFTQLTGYLLDELIGQNPRILKSGLTTTEDYKKIWETILNGGQWRGEFYNRKKNGEYYWEQALISPIFADSGEISHFIAIKEDVTERKQLENQLRHSQKMEAIGQLAGGIAHDFNNILTGIIGYATILQIKLGEAHPSQATVAQIVATAGRGAALTQGLLSFSRKQTTSLVSIELNGVIRRVHSLLEHLIGEDMRLEIDLCHEPLQIMADSVQLEQVIINLATNARDAMQNGGTITIQTEIKHLGHDFIVYHGFGAKGDYARLAISDTGEGIDEVSLKKIFEPFYTTKDTGKGTGLGLAIVYGIVKKHKGYIDCHSLPGMGTIFHIYFPLTTTEEEQPAQKYERVKDHNGTETILLAEDDKTIRELTKELLEEFGYNVIAAENGIEALDEYHRNSSKISLAILDSIMPGMKGMDVYKKIRATDLDTPVLFCSGYASEIPANAANKDSKVYFISKPFVPKQMLMKIREVLGDDN